VTEHAYLRVADDLRRQIIDGTLAPGARMPSQAQIRETYQVSDTVALEARRVLIAEGLAEGRSGSGTFVRPRPVLHRLARSHYQAGTGRGSPFRAEQADAGRTGDWESESETTGASPTIAERLAIEVGARCMRTTYTFRADGRPVMLSTSWEPLAITGKTAIITPEDGPYAGRGVVERMAAIGVTITNALEEVTARPALADEARQLGGVAGHLVLDIQRTYYTEDGKPVETADIVIPADRYRVSYHLPVR
jgi:DNA-binding GntR family transcriptional regulator